MNHIDVLHVALLLAMGAVAYIGWWSNDCRCEKCAFHVNAARIKRLRAVEQKHDYAHKTLGGCGDKACDRNEEAK